MDNNTVQCAEPPRPPELTAIPAPGKPGPGAALKPLVPGMRWLLFAASVLVLLAGFQLFVFTERTGTFFAWTIANPLAGAFLGAGYGMRAACGPRRSGMSCSQCCRRSRFSGSRTGSSGTPRPG
jgi:hypothetical protein